MSAPVTVDTARLPLLLSERRLPTVARLWPEFAERADREGWPAARLLAARAELEVAERVQRRIQRHLQEARLPPGKSLETFEFAAVPTLSRAQIVALAAGDSWWEKRTNTLAGTVGNFVYGPYRWERRRARMARRKQPTIPDP